MRAVQITRFDGPEVLDVVDVPAHVVTACSLLPAVGRLSRRDGFDPRLQLMSRLRMA